MLVNSQPDVMALHSAPPGGGGGGCCPKSPRLLCKNLWTKG